MNLREKQKELNRKKFTPMQTEAVNKGKKPVDPRFWTHTMGKDKKATAIIRFLPIAHDDTRTADFVPTSKYFFKDSSTGKYYVNECPSTIGLPDPVYDYNRTQWQPADEKGCPFNAGVRSRKKQTSNVCNILVIKDSGNPENNGKVFLYRFGAQIMKKLTQAMANEDEDEIQINPFNMLAEAGENSPAGANFKLSVYIDEKSFPNYELSKFLTPSDMDKDDEVMERIWGEVYGLFEFVDPEAFKPYDELKQELYGVLGISQAKMKSERSEEASSPRSEDVDDGYTADKLEDDEEPVVDTSAEDEEDDAKLKAFQAMCKD